MNINIKLNKNFTTQFNKMVEKYGEEFELLNGFHDTQLNYTDFIDNFTKDNKNVADNTIDSNANVSSKDIQSLLKEKGKSHDKLLAFNKIFYELQKKYGVKTAREWLELEMGNHLYLHDSPSTSYYSYCFAYDLSRLAKEGLFFIENYNNEPPRHLQTFLDDVIEYISFASNRTSGAVGVPDILIWIYYFWKKDVENNYYLVSPEYYLRQAFQKLIFRFNQKFYRDQTQTVFSNMSIFDRPYLIELFGGREYPDGTFVIDYIEEIMNIQKIFMEVVSEIRKTQLFTYPVLTYSLIYKDGKFEDEEFARWASRHNMKWNDANFFISETANALSNCPLASDTKILYWTDKDKTFALSSIKDLYHNRSRDNKIPVVDVLSNGQKIKCKINKFDIAPEYEITLVNGAKIVTTADHLNKTYGKNYIKTKDLTTDDYLPYGRHIYKGSDNLTYEEGKLVGAFLGDGSYSKNGITLSLNIDTDKDFIDWIYDYVPFKFGGKISEYKCTSSISGDKKCINIRIISDYLLGLVKQCVKGDDALNKEIKLNVLNYSESFRKGLIDGWNQTDGGNSDRIYTSSLKLVETMNVVFNSLGLVTRIDEDNRENRLGNNTCYTVRYYTPNGRKKFKDVYIIDDNYMWIKIKSIVRCKTNKAVSYCLEVLEDVEPIFTLGNGIITHNCRLVSDTSQLDPFINSIGGTALSVGSIKVSTINLEAIALEYPNNQEDFINRLNYIQDINMKVLDVIRHIIVRNVEKGLLPNVCDGMLELDKCYNTNGSI